MNQIYKLKLLGAFGMLLTGFIAHAAAYDFYYDATEYNEQNNVNLYSVYNWFYSAASGGTQTGSGRMSEIGGLPMLFSRSISSNPQYIEFKGLDTKPVGAASADKHTSVIVKAGRVKYVQGGVYAYDTNKSATNVRTWLQWSNKNITFGYDATEGVTTCNALTGVEFTLSSSISSVTPGFTIELNGAAAPADSYSYDSSTSTVVLNNAGIYKLTATAPANSAYQAFTVPLEVTVTEPTSELYINFTTFQGAYLSTYDRPLTLDESTGIYTITGVSLPNNNGSSAYWVFSTKKPSASTQTLDADAAGVSPWNEMGLIYYKTGQYFGSDYRRFNYAFTGNLDSDPSPFSVETGKVYTITVDPSQHYTFATISGLSGVENVAVGPVGTENDIYNMQGVLLKQNASQEDIDALTPGVYIIGGKKQLVR